MIVVVSGYATAGKDTVADRLVEAHGFRKTFMSKPLHQALLTLNPQVKLTHDEWRRVFPDVIDFHGMGGPLWEDYATLTEALGYDEAKTIEDYRRLLQRMGTEVGRDMFGQNVWLDKVADECIDNEAQKLNTVVTGVRFPNELQTFRAIGATGRAHNPWSKSHTEGWYVIRPGVRPAQGHSGETALNERDFDWVFTNNGTIEDLHECVDLHVRNHF